MATSGSPVSLKCRKSPVAAVPGACTVSGHDPEMVRSAGTQATDVSTDIPVRIPNLTLRRRGVPITGGRTILEINACGQSVRIE
jgi:hypothetical protein